MGKKSFNLRPLRKSLVDPVGEFKMFKPGFIEMSQSKLNHKFDIPNDKSWASGTLTNLSVSGQNTVSLTIAGVVGRYVSPRLIQTDFAEELRKDVNYVKLVFDHTLNSGTIEYYLSNDGGSHFPIQVLTSNAIYKMPTEEDDLDNFQTKFNDLRVLAILNGNTSPVLNSINIFYSLSK